MGLDGVRQAGFAVTTAAEDTECVRLIFIDPVAKPQRTLLGGSTSTCATTPLASICLSTPCRRASYRQQIDCSRFDHAGQQVFGGEQTGSPTQP